MHNSIDWLTNDHSFGFLCEAMLNIMCTTLLNLDKLQKRFIAIVASITLDILENEVFHILKANSQSAGFKNQQF